MLIMKSKLSAVVALCLISCAEMDSPAPEQPEDDSAELAKTPPPPPQQQQEQQAVQGAATANLVGTGPIAYGVIWSDGTKYSGTPNWLSTYNATLKRYEIAIVGESYYYLSYATVVTPAGDSRVCRTSSVSGKLLIYCTDLAGTPQSSRLSFVTSKP